MVIYSLLKWGIHERPDRGEADIVAVTRPAEAAESNRGTAEAYRIESGNTPDQSRFYRWISRSNTIAYFMVDESWLKQPIRYCFSALSYSCLGVHGDRGQLYRLKHGHQAHHQQQQTHWGY